MRVKGAKKSNLVAVVKVGVCKYACMNILFLLLFIAHVFAKLSCYVINLEVKYHLSSFLWQYHRSQDLTIKGE